MGFVLLLKGSDHAPLQTFVDQISPVSMCICEFKYFQTLLRTKIAFKNIVNACVSLLSSQSTNLDISQRCHLKKK